MAGVAVRISMRADYGARAVIDLAQRRGKGLTQTAEIASRQHIPESYLEQLLTTLRKAGIVRSVRGPAGGHELVRDPASLSLGDVLEALDGVSSPNGEGTVNVASAIVLHEVWNDLMNSYRNFVHGITIEQLVLRQVDREARSMYYI
jgi:Rrf2 family transcriptional regulator, cysteine metabolism repressor